MRLLTFPNILSLTRIPLAFFFLWGDQITRVVAILAAMLSDGLDGFFARRYSQSSRLGITLDPLMDKFFVITLLTALIAEGNVSFWEALLFLSRDFSVFFFGLYLVAKGKWQQYQFRSIWCGKLTTFFQFVVLFALTLSYPIPFFFYGFFLLLGFLALVELYMSEHTVPTTS